jgi:phosphatidate cytidylyltransferase
MRFITVAPLVPLIILAILWHRPEAVWGMVFLATGIGLHEYFSMTVKDDATDRWVGVAIGLVAWADVYWGKKYVIAAMPFAVLAPALYHLFRFRDIQTVAARLGSMVFGILYAGLISFLALQKRDFGKYGAGFILLTLMIAWFGDTGAYFAGRFLGKAKLYPAISPGKTRAGAVGGLAGSFLGAVLANVWYFKALGWGHGAVLTLLGGALGQSGDLVESMLKRSTGVKDSGKILPGHGGMLDRVDAVLFIAPWVYTYAALFWHPR